MIRACYRLDVRTATRRSLLAALLAAWALPAACTAPDFGFAPVDAGGAPDDAADTDTDVDADGAIPPPATPIDPIAVDGADLGAACAAAAQMARLADAGADAAARPAFAYTWAPDAGRAHCYLYFANDPYGRSWPESRALCGSVSTTNPSRAGHLATFPSADEALAMQANFRAGQVPWLGLALSDDAAPPTEKSSFAWVTGEPFGYDGWAAGTPAGAPCVAWFANAQWSDFACERRKGVLCELDE